MADRVIISDITFANKMISASEIMQMSGRCGRKIEEKGEVNIFVKEEEVDELINILKNNKHDIKSVLNEDTILFHILPEITNNDMIIKSDLIRWFERSFLYYNNKEIEIDKVIDDLVETGSIRLEGEKIIANEMAYLCVKYYFHPRDVKNWYDNFEKLFNRNIENNNIAIAWALSNTWSEQSDRKYFGYYEYLQNYKDELVAINLESECALTGLIYWSILNNVGLGKIKNIIREYQENFDRIYNVLICLFKNRVKYFNDLYIKIKNKIDNDLLELFNISGMNRKYAKELYELGIRNNEEIDENIDNIELYGSEGLKEFIRNKDD